jgi:hypothetical protein
MALGGNYFDSHPRLALASFAVTTVALGYISDNILRPWTAESYLSLHVSLWWVFGILWRVHLGERPREVPQIELDIESFSSAIRINALLFGDCPQFHDAEAEQDEDYPVGAPLFRKQCFSIGGWTLDTLTISPWQHSQEASFRGEGECVVTIAFFDWGHAWHVCVKECHGNEEQLRNFVSSLHSGLSGIDRLTAVRWFDHGPAFHAQMSEAATKLGTDCPFTSSDKDGAFPSEVQRAFA